MPAAERRDGGLPKRPERTTLSGILTAANITETIQYRGDFIPLSNINVLPQGRKTFEDIDILADDIASKHLMNPPLVARLTIEACGPYLEKINKIWNTKFKIDDLHKTEEKEGEYVYILIAGERRYRASKSLTEHACTRCMAQYGNKPCYSRHFTDNLMEVRVCDNISPIEAVFRQASENTYMSIPPHEEAVYYDALMRVSKEEDPSYSLSQFAKDVGRGEDKVRDAIRFCRLPIEIQEHVREGRITYGIATEIARLAEAKAPQGDIDYYITSVLAGRTTAKDFTKTISNYLGSFDKNQMSLLDLFDEGQRGQLSKGNIKRVVERDIIRAIWTWIYYFRRVTDLFNEGLLGKDDSAFSHASPLRVYRNLLNVQIDLLPHFVDLMRKPEYEETGQALAVQVLVIDSLLESAPEEISNTDLLL